MSVIVLTAIDKRHDLALYDIDNKAWVDIVFDRDSHRFEPTADGKPVPFADRHRRCRRRGVGGPCARRSRPQGHRAWHVLPR